MRPEHRLGRAPIGYAGDRVAGTVALLAEGDTVAFGPGMAADRRLILGPLAEPGIEPQEVTEVAFGHHHPDPPGTPPSSALFPEARFHDHMAVHRDDIREDREDPEDPEDREADGCAISPSITGPGRRPLRP